MGAYKTYITINNLHTEKCYIGMTKYTRESNYKGSGILISKAIKKYGNKNFTRIDLGEFDNKDECHYWEGFYIKLYKTLKSQGGYNLSPTGGLGSPGCFSEETKKKIGDKSRIHLIGKKYSEKTKQRMSDSHKGLLKGKKLSEKHKLNIAKSHLGLKHSDETKNKFRNKIFSEETRKKLSEKAFKQWENQKLLNNYE